ncbi:MAG TPA: SGNH/GDSL hydrolase family protein [Xanthobacteraceae bacterium]|jgi:hypothetical protein
MVVGAAFAALLALASPAPAATDENCGVPAIFAEPLAPLSRTTIAAKRDGKLDILLLSGSPSQTGAAKGLRSYPLFFQDRLRERLPGLEIRVSVRAAPRRSVSELLPQLSKLLADVHPSLVIWQAGTADAYRGVDAEDFAGALRDGVTTILRASADVVLVDMQYSPRTDQLIDAANYLAYMRSIADSMDIPLFSRYEIMRYWSDSGTFDFTSLKDDGLFEKVHHCMGKLLADFVLRATQLDEFKGAQK